MQSKFSSGLEVVTTTAIKFVISMLIWRFIVAPLYDMPYDVQTNLGITCIFTVSSIITGYFIRRRFNHHTVSRFTAATKEIKENT